MANFLVVDFIYKKNLRTFLWQIKMVVFVCVCACERERERESDEAFFFLLLFWER